MARESKKSARLIKRYGNRKLYDVEASRYVTLDGIRALVHAGTEVRVVDNDSGEDLTRITLAQIIYEAEKKPNGGTPALSLGLLRRLVQAGDDAVRDLRRGVERGREALESVREAAEQRVNQLVGKREGKRRPPSLLEGLLVAPQRTLDELQHRIDAQVRQSIERIVKHPVLQREIHRIEESLHQLEVRLGRTTKPRRAKPAKPVKPSTPRKGRTKTR